MRNGVLGSKSRLVVGLYGCLVSPGGCLGAHVTPGGGFGLNLGLLQENDAMGEWTCMGHHR
jgi:hypothetical protein